MKLKKLDVSNAVASSERWKTSLASFFASLSPLSLGGNELGSPIPCRYSIRGEGIPEISFDLVSKQIRYGKMSNFVKTKEKVEET